MEKIAIENSKKIALVTGGNKGLGFETACQLMRRNIHVVVTARVKENLLNAKVLIESRNLRADYQLLDVTNEDHIQKLEEYIAKEYGQLDILINNAGISKEKSTSYAVNTSLDVSLPTLKEIYNTNVFGMIALTNAMLPLLFKSNSARIVNVGSELGSLTLHADPASRIYPLKKFAYNSSKTILNQYTIHLAAAVASRDIKVNSVSPGWVRTDMGTSYAPLSVEEGAQIIVTAATLPEGGPSGSFFTHEMQTIPW